MVLPNDVRLSMCCDLETALQRLGNDFGVESWELHGGEKEDESEDLHTFLPLEVYIAFCTNIWSAFIWSNKRGPSMCDIKVGLLGFLIIYGLLKKWASIDDCCIFRPN